MGKFKVLQTNQIYMTRIGNYSFNLTEPTNDFLYSIVTWIIIMTMVIPLISAAILVYNDTYDFTSKLNSVFMFVGLSQGLGAYLNCGIQMKNTKLLHLKLQTMVDQVQNDVDDDEAYEIYWQTEQKCRKYTKFMWIFFIINIQAAYYLLFISSVFALMKGNTDTSTYPALFDLALPFDTTTLIGWFAMWALLTIMDLSYVLGMVSASSYFSCTCLYIQAMCDHYDSIMQKIQAAYERKHSDKSARVKLEYHTIKELAHKAIDIHVYIYDVFKDVEEINSGSIFSLLLPNVIFVGITLYNMEHSLLNMSPIDGFYSILCSCFGLTWPFLFCYYSNLITDRIAGIGTSTYGLNWFEFPTELQRYVTLIVARSQQPLFFTGLGLIYCTIENFGMLLKSSCSYYLIFRSFSET